MPFDWFGLRKSRPEVRTPPPMASRRGRLDVIALPRNGAWAAWQRALAEAAGTGRCPLLLGTQYVTENRMEPEGSAEEILAEAETVDLPRWLRQRIEENGAQDGFDPGGLRGKGGETPSFTLIDGINPVRPESHTFLAYVPCAESWMAPSVAPFGDWNDCPPDAYRVAMFRAWNRNFGAELVGYSHDIAELYVRKPVQDPKTARELAWEMYAYAPDIVGQGEGTVRDLACTLLGSSTWFFWWD